MITENEQKVKMPKSIKWLYDKGDKATFYEKQLRLCMFLRWSKDQLYSLKINKLI